MSKESFRENLKQAKQTVDSWPEWKQRALGGGPSSVRRAGTAGRVIAGRPHPQEKHPQEKDKEE